MTTETQIKNYAIYMCKKDLLLKSKLFLHKNKIVSLGKGEAEELNCTSYFFMYDLDEKELARVIVHKNKQLQKIKKAMNDCFIVENMTNFLQQKHISIKDFFCKAFRYMNINIIDSFANNTLGQINDQGSFFEDFYILPKKLLQKTKLNSETFFTKTAANFENADFDFKNTLPSYVSLKKESHYYNDEDDMYLPREYDSNVSSVYFYTEKGVYRLSNHWGEVSTCTWVLDNPKRVFDGNINFNDKLSFEDCCEDCCEDNWSVGFCKWEDFYDISFL